MSDQRLSKQTANTRKSTAARSRTVTEDRKSADAVRLEEFRNMNAQAMLPTLPEIPGYHVCYLTSNNSRDSLQARFRIGYEPITVEEAPGFENAVGKAGSGLDGMIHINEMVACKIEEDRYQMYMLEAHHYAPGREEEKLTSQADAIAADLKRKGASLSEGDGLEAMRNLDSIAEPIFT
jgi:hypothetical protein